MGRMSGRFEEVSGPNGIEEFADTIGSV